MTDIKKGDFILHNSNGKVLSISVAQTDCYGAHQPKELSDAETSVNWNDEGYRVDTKYFDFDIPLSATTHSEWLMNHYIENSAFTITGRGKQQYMCHLADDHAIYFLENAIRLQSNKELVDYLGAALDEIVEDKDSEYDLVETESINSLIEDRSIILTSVWQGKKEPQAMTVSPATGRAIPKRNPKVAVAALAHADFKCEYNSNDKTFLRKNGTPYTEPHHLIPISKYRDFDYSVDVMENIVSLCSHCHNLLHYGRFEDKATVLEKLYYDRLSALETCGLSLSLDQLESYYQN